MPQFFVNNPKDLLVVRVDGAIGHRPTGKGHKNRHILTQEGKSHVVYRADDPGLDLCYVSVEGLVPSNEAVLRKKLRDAFLHSPQKEEIADTIEDYFGEVAKVSINAALLGDAYKEVPAGDEKLQSLIRDAIKHYVFAGRGYLQTGSEGQGKDVVYEQAVHEMKRLFPHAEHLGQAVKPDENYPYITIDKEKLKQYFGSHIPKEAQLDAFVDKAVTALKGECRSAKLSAPSKRLIDKIRKFPSQVRQKRLRPLFELPFVDDTLTIQLSPGAFISDWTPILTLDDIIGVYRPGSNTMTIPAKEIEERAYSPSEMLGRPLLPCCADLPAIEVSHTFPPTLHEVRFEEMFHYVMQAVFMNNGHPYSEYDQSAKKGHIDAIIADVAADGDKPNPEAIKKLGLKLYMEDDIDFKQHLEEGMRPGSSKNIGAEIIAKLAGLIEQDGWEATRATLPHLCDDFENRVLPRCYELCRAHGIDVPGPESSNVSHQGRVKRTGWKRA